MASVAERLRKLGSYEDLVSYAAPFGDDWLAFFERCPRGDWLLALAARLGADRRALVRAAVSCAREALSYAPEADATLEAALEAALRWTCGSGSELECDEQAARVVALPPASDAASDAAVQAVAAVLSCVREPSAAAHVAACAAHAAAVAAGECAMHTALRYAHERCATLSRAELSPAMLAKLAGA